MLGSSAIYTDSATMLPSTAHSISRRWILWCREYLCMKLARALILMATVSALQAQVETVAVVSNSVQGKFRLTGEFLPYQSVAIFARVNGYVEQVQVDVGSVV